MAYRYVAFTPSGEQVRGSIDAPTEDVAERALWDWGYKIVTLRRSWAAPQLDKMLPTLFSIKTREIITFCRQMATLVESGIAVLPALELLGKQARPRLRRVMEDIVQAIKQGGSFSDALREHPQVFPPIFGRMIAIGERTGNLEMVLRQLAEHMEKEQAIIKRVRGAMAYPAFVMLLAVGVVGVLVTTALPPLLGLFDEFGAQPPFPLESSWGSATSRPPTSSTWLWGWSRSWAWGPSISGSPPAADSLITCCCGFPFSGPSRN